MPIIHSISDYLLELDQLSHNVEILQLPLAKRQKALTQIKKAQSAIQSVLMDLSRDDAQNVHPKILLWERKLLDLTLRNMLLNMRIGRSVIPIDCEDIVSFADNIESGNEIVLDTPEVTGIYRASRTNMEESGANTLFLAIGVLCWTDNNGKVHKAPILLIPVNMVSIKKGKYAIRKRDEETIVNHTLVEFLFHEYEIDLHQLVHIIQDGSAVNVPLILNTVQDAIHEQQGWTVEKTVYLGNFSFTKFVLWNDIHSHHQQLLQSPLVKSLIEGRLQLEDIIEPQDAKQMDIDLRPCDVLLPISADSSQMEAVVDADKGRSFVLYGPPGTGKSQTITNIIANAIGHGKRVLFVAEKRAALDVVYERLTQIGLAPFCLALHSNKIEKNKCLEQLQHALETAGKVKIEDFEFKSNHLYEQRMQLVGYINSLHKPISDGLSLYDCINRFISLNADPTQLPKGFAENQDETTLEELSQQIRQMAAAAQVLGCSISEHPLLGLTPTLANNDFVNKKSFSISESAELYIQQLPTVLDDMRAQIERMKQVHINKSLRDYFESNYQLKKMSKVLTVDDSLKEDIDELYAASERWKENASKWEEWKKFHSTLYGLRQLGLDAAINMFLRGEDIESICKSVSAAYYQQKALYIISQCPQLNQFSGLTFEHIIDTYLLQAQEFQQLTKKMLLSKLAERIPIQTRSEILGSEMTLLKKRIAGKGRGTTIRTILGQMPNLLPMLCPVMIMSPLAVAQFLDMTGSKFDVVIFDEASQMPTCEAVGAIMRAQSVIVVGDPMQMPPTNFFTTNISNEEELETDDLESILDDCISLSLPSRYLRWHYRSKHESLITFSNLNFYDGKLVTFPSVDNMISRVTMQHVDGVYDFGNTRTNIDEARAIVDEAMIRIKQQPQRSIGIITFSRAQSDLIEDLLSEAFAANPSADRQNSEANEPIFVKNLENVQGDERDIILFSVCYGPDKDGNLSLNFGPLNQVGGERRLNVAVSRARYEMKIFTTLLPEQIDEKRTHSAGALGLKHFLEFARQGNGILGKAEQDIKDMPIIDQIYQRLVMLGYKVDKNVGLSDCRVDLAIRDNNNKNVYKLGIMCDGESYYGLKTTRDREIVRPAVLRSLGWRLIRVWSIDWFNHQDMVISNIVKELNC